MRNQENSARVEARQAGKIARWRRLANKDKGLVEDALDGILSWSMDQVDPRTSEIGIANPFPLLLTAPTIGPIDLLIKAGRVTRRAYARRRLRPIDQAEKTRTAEQAAAEHQALVEEVRKGGYHYTFIDVRKPGEDGAFRDIQVWTIVGRNRDGEKEILKRSERLSEYKGHPITLRNYYGSHDETTYSPREAEERGRAIHAILYPQYLAEQDRLHPSTR